MTTFMSEDAQKQRKWEDEFRKRFPMHPALILIDGLLKLDAAGARAIEQLYVPFSGDQGKLVSKARELAHGRTGKDFQGIVSMLTNAALRAAPDNWESVEIFRLGACADAALWGVLAQESLKPAEYYALARACAVAIPDINDPGGLPDKEEPVIAAIKTAEVAEAVEEVVPLAAPALHTNPNAFIDEAKTWADANPELYAEFLSSKMGYAGGAFSYTCEKVIKDAGHANDVARGQRALGAFAILAAQGPSPKAKGATKWWAGREVAHPPLTIINAKEATIY